MLTMVGRYARQKPSLITVRYPLFKNSRNRRKCLPIMPCSLQRSGSVNCPFQPHRMDPSASFRDLMATSGSPSLAAIVLGASLPWVPLPSLLFPRLIAPHMGSPQDRMAISGSLNLLAIALGASLPRRVPLLSFLFPPPIAPHMGSP